MKLYSIRVMMNRRTTMLACTALLLTGACARRDDGAARGDSAAAEPVTASDTALRRELLERVKRDQEIRDRLAAELRRTGIIADTTGRQMAAIDSANVAWLKPLLLQRSLPTKGEVGKDGVDALFLLVQHADADTAFQAAILPKLDSAFAAGEMDGDKVALLTDRVMKARTGRQVYGTQASIADGKVTIDPIDDSANVDARRRKMGMMPLADYKKLLDSVYAKK